jgi:hypothetical protein
LAGLLIRQAYQGSDFCAILPQIELRDFAFACAGTNEVHQLSLKMASWKKVHPT